MEEYLAAKRNQQRAVRDYVGRKRMGLTLGLGRAVGVVHRASARIEGRLDARRPLGSEAEGFYTPPGLGMRYPTPRSLKM